MKKAVWISLIAAGCGMLVFGLISGEAATVFHKASVICLECIGIG